MHSTTSTFAESDPIETISNSMNTAEAMTTDGLFINVLNPDVLVTGNILEFAEALTLPLG